MRELELDGIHDDGMHVVVIDSDGERYTLPIDEALRAAVRRDRPSLAAVRTGEPAPLRPREIQTMLRSGRSAEDIAEAHEVPVEHVRRYEGPVLAEREWTAQRARTFPVGRGGPALAEVVAERLTARQASQDVAWDAWRRADGTWTLELSFAAAGRTRQAHWVADLDARSISPVDDEARWISDEDGPPEPVRGRARLMAVKSSVYDVEADGEFDGGSPRRRTGGRPSSRPSTAPAPSRSFSENDLDALNARRGLRSVPPPEDEDPVAVWSTLEDDAEEAEDAVPTAPLAPGSADGSDDDRRDAAVGTGPLSAGSASETLDEGIDPTEDLGSEESSGPAAGTRSARTSMSAESALPSASAASAEASPLPARSPSSDEPEEGNAPSSLHHQDTVDLTALPGFEDPGTGRGDGGTGSGEDPTEDGQQSASARKPAKSRSKRASIPSWDEIVFGSKHD